MYYLVKFCCLCLNNTKTFKQIFDMDDDNIRYYVKLKSSFPQMCFEELKEQTLICSECIQTLNIVYKFWKKCIKSKKMLLNYISQLHTVSQIRGEICIKLVKTRVIDQNNDENEKNTANNQFENKTEKIENSCSVVDNLERNQSSFGIQIKNEDRIFQNGGENSEKIEDISNETNGEQIQKTVKDINFDEIKMETDEISEEDYYSSSDGDGFENKTVDDQNFSVSMGTEMDFKCKPSTSQKPSTSIFCLPRSYECTTCLESFPSESALQDHSKTHGPVSQCTLCPKTFKFPENLERHLKLHFEAQNAPKKRPYKCRVCLERFSAPSVLKNHMKLHSQDSYKCVECNEVFISEGIFNKHMEAHGPSEHECTVCFERFGLASILVNHMRTHSEHQCKVCGQNFISKNFLNRHLEIHGGKTYECSSCGRRFHQLSQLSKHARTHSKKPCQIDIFHMEMKSNHLKTNHQTKSYRCKICGLVSRDAQHFSEHQLIHDAKGYECGVCKKKFKVRSRLEAHRLRKSCGR